MKDLLIAKTAGFCFGVKRAIDSVYKSLDEYDELYSIGQVIHNERVVDDLSKQNSNKPEFVKSIIPICPKCYENVEFDIIKFIWM